MSYAVLGLPSVDASSFSSKPHTNDYVTLSLHFFLWFYTVELRYWVFFFFFFFHKGGSGGDSIGSNHVSMKSISDGYKWRLVISYDGTRYAGFALFHFYYC